MKKPRLTDSDRLAIETGLKSGKTVYNIAKALSRPVTTITREIRARAVESDKGAAYRVTNRCAFKMAKFHFRVADGKGEWYTMTVMRYLIIIVGAVLVNNFVLNRFLGCCPFLGVSKKTETALGMSGAVVFVMTVASAVTWCLDHWLLDPLGLGYIHTLAFILVIASLVQFIDIAMKRFVPPLHAALGIFLPLITTNCAVLGVAELNCKNGTPFLESVLFSFAAALGFGFALVIFSGLREKLAWADPPRCFRGIAVALVTAGLLSLAFMGFNGLVKLPY